MSYLGDARRIAEAELAKLPPEPVDWPARFRAAAQAADRAGWIGIGAHLQDLASRIRVSQMPSDVVEAIGRALTGEAS